MCSIPRAGAGSRRESSARGAARLSRGQEATVVRALRSGEDRRARPLGGEPQAIGHLWGLDSPLIIEPAEWPWRELRSIVLQEFFAVRSAGFHPAHPRNRVR